MQVDDPKWNEEETYRFLLKYYSKAAVMSSESLSAQETIQQLYQMGRYDPLLVWVSQLCTTTQLLALRHPLQMYHTGVVYTRRPCACCIAGRQL